jgi:hypothetical protein
VETIFWRSLKARPGNRNRYFGRWYSSENHWRTLVRLMSTGTEKNSSETLFLRRETLPSFLPLRETSLALNPLPDRTGIHGLSIVKGTKVPFWQMDCPISNCPDRGLEDPGQAEIASDCAYLYGRLSPKGEEDREGPQ